MRQTVRPAQSGDMCVLLEPDKKEILDLHQRQMSLRVQFGGRPHDRVHLTCQRFILADDRALPQLIKQLTTSTKTVSPFPIIASSLLQFEHRFWKSRLLRWRIDVTDRLHTFCALIDEILLQQRAELHYPFSSSWEPKLVTALEAIPEIDVESYLRKRVFPHYLFTARYVAISRIEGPGTFDILARSGLRA